MFISAGALGDDEVAKHYLMGHQQESHIPFIVVEEIRYIVKRQELELESLQKKLDQMVSSDNTTAQC